jgi:hypothetical protein
MPSDHLPTRPSPAELRRAGLVITLGTWALITAVCTFSAITSARFIGAHSPLRWSGWILAAGIDAAFVMALQADATLARYGATGGPWPTAFRWTTGTCSVFVNTGDAALQRDEVGVTIHLIAPALLLVLGEAGPAWRRQLVSLDYLPEPDNHRPPEPAPPPRSPALTPAQPSSANGKQRIPIRPPGSPRGGRQPATGPGRPSIPPADTEEAHARIVDGWLTGLSQRDTARLAHRSPTYVRKVWSSLDKDQRGTTGAPPQGPSPSADLCHQADIYERCAS